MVLCVYMMSRVYDVPGLMAPLEKKKEYTELGKVVDIVYRERGK